MRNTKEDEYSHRDPEKTKREAHELIRPGYWGCEHCSAHNENFRTVCTACCRERNEQVDFDFESDSDSKER